MPSIKTQFKRNIISQLRYERNSFYSACSTKSLLAKKHATKDRVTIVPVFFKVQLIKVEFTKCQEAYPETLNAIEQYKAIDKPEG